MNISIIGAGYVGLVTAACLAEKGHRVVCVEQNRLRVEQINRAEPPIYERGLRELLQTHVGSNLVATRDLELALTDSELTLIAVGTPFNGRRIDLLQVETASRQIGNFLRHIHRYHLVVIKSTVVPGTTDDVIIPILEATSAKKAGLEFGVGMNPEFLTEGQAISDFMRPDRIVIGANDESSLQMLMKLYKEFADVPLVKTNCRTAEMIKYASNAMLATQISFANEIANLGAALGGIDVVDVMRGVHLSHYLRHSVGNGLVVQAPISSFLKAGCGFGGSCLPKDVNALIAHGQEAGQPIHLLQAVIDINRTQPLQVLRLLHKHFESLRDIRITVLGLAFKPDTDDMRQSPAIMIIRHLLQEGARLKGYDPIAKMEARKLFSESELALCDTLQESIQGADAVIVVTCWKEFEQVPQMIAELDPQPLLVDGRRMLNKQSVKRYEGIGL